MAKPFDPRPTEAIASLLRHRDLVRELVKRDFLGRYKGSAIGIGWSLFNPLLMLTIYTFVFGVALKTSWSSNHASKASFAMILFSGMIVHGFFAECLNRAPNLVTSTPSYVKKVVFPIEVLAWVAVASALLHFLVSFAVLMLFSTVLGADIGPNLLLVPVVMLPLLLLSVGVTWALSSLGVYLRDLGQSMGIITTVLLFLSPVFYAIDALPPRYQKLMYLNPLTTPIEQLRALVLWSRPLDWMAWLQSFVLGTAVFCAGFWWFQRTRRGFSDVI